MINVVFWNAGVRNNESDKEKIDRIEKALENITEFSKKGCPLTIMHGSKY